MTAASMPPQRSLVIPLSASVVLHLAFVAALILAKANTRTLAMPPVYRVQLVAAPAGDRAFGVVEPAKAAPGKASPPRARQAPPRESVKRAPATKTVRATASAPKPPSAADRKPEQAKAGGGPVGGKGTDVANVDLAGLDFPYPGLPAEHREPDREELHVEGAADLPGRRAVHDPAGRFGGGDSRAAVVQCRVRFQARGNRGDRGSGEDARVRSAPRHFADDVLPVIFSFDPRIIR